MKKDLDEEIKAKLARRESDWEAIAGGAGISLDWIRKFMRGKIPNPGINTLRKVRSYLAGLRKVP